MTQFYPSQTVTGAQELEYEAECIQILHQSGKILQNQHPQVKHNHCRKERDGNRCHCLELCYSKMEAIITCISDSKLLWPENLLVRFFKMKTFYNMYFYQKSPKFLLVSIRKKFTIPICNSHLFPGRDS